MGNAPPLHGLGSKLGPGRQGRQSIGSGRIAVGAGSSAILPPGVAPVSGIPILSTSSTAVLGLGAAAAGFINDAEAEADLGAASSAEEPEE